MKRLDILINADSKIPVYRQIQDCIKAAVRDGILKKDDHIPSINELSDDKLLARGTVEKAYKELRDEKVIYSVKGKGYFIARTDIAAPLNVLLVFNKISNYKKQIFTAFHNTLGTEPFIEFQFHHHSVPLFDNLISNRLGDYDYYVIMPHFYEEPEKVLEIVQRIPPEKLILLDRDLPGLKGAYGLISQNFAKDISDKLYEALPRLQKYDCLVYANPVLTPYPDEIKKGFESFCRMHDFPSSIINGIELHTPVSKGQAFIIIEENDLVNLVKICQHQGLQIGHDVGIVSYNETPLKEILLDGITVISTDHEQMGVSAAQMILDKKLEKIKNPFKLILRNSL